jgi:hypothetical protein
MNFLLINIAANCNLSFPLGWFGMIIAERERDEQT